MKRLPTTGSESAADPGPMAAAESSDAAADRGVWTGPLCVVGLGVLGLLVLYWQTAASMVAIWWRSDTFAHGFLIPLISLYLIWDRRRVLASLRPRPDAVGLAAFAGLALGWLVAQLMGVLVVEQLALMSMIGAAVWAILGRRTAWEIAFPLGYLLFAVPIGEFLIYPMMDFTAAFLVRMLELTGIPVYWEGTYVSIPSGDWSIVEGCSGVRYIIASIAVGTLYAYMFYRSIWRRLAFVVLSLAMPIVANGLRAYMIVMIGHLSDMRLATGVDHLIYGWVFFGLVIMLMFWIGSFWWDSKPRGEMMEGEPEDAAPTPGAALTRVSLMGFLVLLAAAPGPLATVALTSAGGPVSSILPAPVPAGAWQQDAVPVTDWQPRYLGETAKLAQTYRSADGRVALYVFYYQGQRQGAELINSQNVMVIQKHPVWQNRGDTTPEATIGGEPTTVRETLLQSPAQRLLVWDWYWIDGHITTHPLLAKLLEAKAALLRSGGGSAGVILAVDLEGNEQQGRDTLQAFITAMDGPIQAMLREKDRELAR